MNKIKRYRGTTLVSRLRLQAYRDTQLGRYNVRQERFGLVAGWVIRGSVNGSGVMIETGPMPALTVPGSLEGVDGFNRVSVTTCNRSMLPAGQQHRMPAARPAARTRFLQG